MRIALYCLLTVVFCLSLTLCRKGDNSLYTSESKKANETTNSGRANQVSPSISISSKEIEGVISPTSKGIWKGELKNIGGATDWQYIKLSDTGVSYITDIRKNIYKSTNNGRFWEKMTLPLLPDMELYSTDFIPPSIGWVAVHQYIPRSQTILNNQMLYTKDGGEHWNTTAIGKADFDSIQFANETHGWAWGNRCYHSSDQGQSWEDVTDILCASMSRKPYTNCSFYALVGTTNRQAFVLANDIGKGVVLKTEDGGREWRLFVSLILNRYGYTEPWKAKVGVEGDVWFLGAYDSKEGAGSDFFRVMPDQSVNIYHLSCIIKDIVVSSNNRLFAAGYTYQGKTHNSQMSVILYSSDGGTHWETIYSNPAIHRINAIDSIDPDHVWAVGSNGSVIKVSSRIGVK